MDKSTDIKDSEAQFPDKFPDNIHIGNDRIDTIPSKPRGFTEKLGIFRKGEVDRSSLPNQRDGWYITAIYIANPEGFHNLLRLVHDSGEEFCLEDLCEAGRKVRHGGFHELQILLLRHCEMSPSFSYVPSNGEESWQVIQICRLLNLLRCLDIRAQNPFALERRGLIHYHQAISGDIRGVSYYSYFYGMLDNSAEKLSTESLLEICAIRNKLSYGPNIYRAIAAIYAGSRNRRVNGFDGHKHLASPFLPTVHIEVFYEPSTRFTEGESPNPHNIVLALKEAALQFNRYGKVLEPVEVYDAARDGSLDRWGIPSQNDLDDFADSGVWRDDWDLKTKDPNRSRPGKYPFDLEPAPEWNWGVPRKTNPQVASATKEALSSKADHSSAPPTPICVPKISFSSLRSAMRRTHGSWKETTAPCNATHTAPTSFSGRRRAAGDSSTGALAGPSGSWRSLSAGIRDVLRRPPLPTAFRPQGTAILPPSTRASRSTLFGRARRRLARLRLSGSSGRSVDSGWER